MIDQEPPGCGEEKAENLTLETGDDAAAHPHSQEAQDSSLPGPDNVAQLAQSTPSALPEAMTAASPPIDAAPAVEAVPAVEAPISEVAPTAVEAVPASEAAPSIASNKPATQSEPTSGGSGSKHSGIKKFKLTDFWWVAASFILPFAALGIYLIGQNAFAVKLCLRSGLVGTTIAVTIFALWKLDAKITGFRAPDVSTELVLRMLGMMLWLVWVGASHVILLATDEVYPPTDLSYLGAKSVLACGSNPFGQ